MAETQVQDRARIIAAYGEAQRRAVVQATIRIQQLWRELSTSDLDRSWMRVGPAIVRALSAGQLLAASTGQSYVDAVVRADRAEPEYEPEASTVTYRALSGAASDGRPLETLTYEPVIRTKTLIKGGLTLSEAMLGGMAQMNRIVANEVATAGSSAAGIAMVANRTVTGYVRAIRPGACARCAILAGRWYRYNADFQRHPHCGCYGVPSTRSNRGHLTDPMSFFNGLSRAEQDRRFTIGGAAAIREGADISQVVNVRRKGALYTTTAYGRTVSATREGTSRLGSFYEQMRREETRRTGVRYAQSRTDVRRGIPSYELRTPRLTPSQIFRMSEDRTELIRLLKRFGYLT